MSTERKLQSHHEESQEIVKIIDGTPHRRVDTGYTIKQYFAHVSEETGKPGPGWDRHIDALEKYGVEDVSELPDTPYYRWEPARDWRTSADTKRSLDSIVETLKIPEEELEDENTVILDIGSGSREGLKAGMKKYGYKAKVISVDPRFSDSTNKSNGATHRKEKAAVAALAQALPFKDGSVDRVYANWSVPYYLENMSEIGHSIEQMIRILKPGGIARIFPVPIEQEAHVRSLMDKQEGLRYSLENDSSLDEEDEMDWLLTVEKE